MALIAAQAAANAATSGPVGGSDTGDQPSTHPSYALRVQPSAALITIDRASILATGRTTLGDVLQALPQVAGSFTNPRVNVGGGTGAATISLHGFGAERTLLLVNGQRVLNNDVNTIPINSIERIEVLAEGASTRYGSGAEAGVVNVILRRELRGAEFSADYGISDRGDGTRHGYRFTFGQGTDRGSLVAGVDYNRQDAIASSRRAFSRDALYLYYGTARSFPSSRTPTGLIALPANLKTQFGCTAVTLKQLGLGGGKLDDYRCYTSADGFNFQANGPVVVTPQERSNAFAIGSYRLGDAVESYLQYFHDKTQSASSLAPQFVDTLGSGLVVSKDNYYNPFGVDFSNYQFRFKTRTVGNGNRITHYGTTTDQVLAGFDGAIGTSWRWNAWLGYSHVGQLAHTSGSVDPARINAQLGPSYRDPSGQIVCGAPASGPIAGCTPVDIFNIVDPATVAALASASTDTFTNSVSLERSAEVDVDGVLLELPGGDVRLAAGVLHRHDSMTRIPDATQLGGPDGSCYVGSACVLPLSGSYGISEAYAQLHVPLLGSASRPDALGVDLGQRYSRSAAFGSTTGARLAVTWQPHDDLILDASVSDVFRAPSISDLFAGSEPDPAFAIDPCYHLVGKNAACAYVPGDGTFSPLPEPSTYPLGVASGSRQAGVSLRAERGRSFNWRARYQAGSRLRLGIDAWRVYLRDTIGRVTAQQVLDSCFTSDGGPYCALIHRNAEDWSRGYIDYVEEPIGNLGRVDASGVDLDARYALDAPIGHFSVDLHASWLDRFAIDPAPGLPGDFARDYAGHYATAAALAPGANFPQWKALAAITGNRGAWSATWTLRYIGRFRVGFADPAYNESPCANTPPGCSVTRGARVYHNLTIGHDFVRFNTRLDIGIDNLTDRQPPIVYANNSPDNNTDAATFDTVGRFYWTRITLMF